MLRDQLAVVNHSHSFISHLPHIQVNVHTHIQHLHTSFLPPQHQSTMLYVEAYWKFIKQCKLNLKNEKQKKMSRIIFPSVDTITSRKKNITTEKIHSLTRPSIQMLCFMCLKKKCQQYTLFNIIIIYINNKRYITLHKQLVKEAPCWPNGQQPI